MSLYKYPLYDHFWPVFAICVFIFHKTEVLMVILRGSTDLNLDWVKSYGLRCSLRLRASSANSQKIATDRWSFLDHIWPFFANYMFVFYKTEIQTIILRCLMSLNLNWYKSYDTNEKTQKMPICVFEQNCKKTEMEIFPFCVLTFEPIRTNQNLDQLSMSK